MQYDDTNSCTNYAMDVTWTYHEILRHSTRAVVIPTQNVKKLWMVLKVPEWQRGRESGKIEDAGQVIGAE